MGFYLMGLHLFPCLFPAFVFDTPVVPAHGWFTGVSGWSFMPHDVGLV
jgi:hypothetical protein